MTNTTVDAVTSNGTLLGENLIFLLTLPRSGSTLLQRILASHPDVHSIAEPWLMLHPLYGLKRTGINAEYDSNLARQGLDDFTAQLPEGEEAYIEALRHMASHLYGRALDTSGRRYFLDKTPRYYHIIPELVRVFPRAKYVFLLRNPAAIYSSVLATWFDNDPANMANTAHHDDLYYGPSLLAEGLQLIRPNAAVIHYESLVNTPEQTIRELCDKIGLSFDNELIRYGRVAPPPGTFGDHTHIDQHDAPVPSYAENWASDVNSENQRRELITYIRGLGEDTVSGLGYDYGRIIAAIKGDASPVTVTKSLPNESTLDARRVPIHGKATGTAEIVTTIAPRNIELQQRAIETWRAFGFRVTSLNVPEEIAAVRDHFPAVSFVPANRSGSAITGKPLVFFDDIVAYLKASDNRLCGIVNSDISLKADNDVMAVIAKHSENGFMYGSRVDTQGAHEVDGPVYTSGFDYFFFDRWILDSYPSSGFMIGMPWWDYWAPTIPILRGFRVNRCVSPIAYHEEHPRNYSDSLFVDFGQEYVRLLAANYLSEFGESFPAIELNYRADINRLVLQAVGFLERRSAKLIIPEWDAFRSNVSGERAFAAGDTTTATAAFTEALRHHPRSIRAHNNIATLCWHQGQTEEAVHYLSEAFSMSPDDRLTVLNLGSVMESLGNHSEALSLYNMHLARCPDDTEVAEAMRSLTRPNEAVQLTGSGPRA